MQLSDYIIRFFEDKGIKHCFMLVGGAAMYMNDSLGRSERIGFVACLHEQAAGIAAEAYARITNRPSLIMVTSGPGGTNVVTPVAAAYIESTPMFILSGQVKRADMINGQGIRQQGMQEVDIVSVVKPITKYAACVTDPESIRYHLEHAWREAVTGRPGPVWIDVPLDVQATQIEPETLDGYSPANYAKPEATDAEISEVVSLLQSAERPCLMLGNGVRLSGYAEKAAEFAESLGVPVLTTWNGIDLIYDEHPLYFGRPGGVGQRAANFIQQNSDFLLTVGARLNLLQTGFAHEGFARYARRVMVDIDPFELKKSNVHPHLAIHSDAGLFMDKLTGALRDIEPCDRAAWFDRCRKLTAAYPVMLEEYKSTPNGVNSFAFVRALSEAMREGDTYVSTSSGSAIDVSMLVFKVKRGQRIFSTKGLASMGFDLPSAIGAALASRGRVVCVTGDGGFQMNVQELETLRRLQLPIKLFVLDNMGYAMIYHSHRGAFDGKLTACTPDSGLTLPDCLKQAAVYGIDTAEINVAGDLRTLDSLLSGQKPLICRVNVSIAQTLLPRQTSFRNARGQMESLPLEYMKPPVSDEEMAEIMIGKGNTV
jgi:acetolactate synthase-1/2/3 large subunit